MQGIYSITNTVNGKVYVGHSVDCLARLGQHRSKLKSGSHHNPHLQASVNKYGLGVFVFAEVVCGPFDQEELVELEQFHMDTYRRSGVVLFNMIPASGSRLGAVVSIESRRRMSVAKMGNQNLLGHRHMLGFRHSAESKELMRLSQLGNQKALGHQNTLGFRHSETTKREMSRTRRLRNALLREAQHVAAA